MSGTGLDLRGVERFVREQVLVDELVVERDNGLADDSFNTETGNYDSPEAAQVYAGPGAVQSLSGFTELDDPDVARIVETTEANYRMLTPLAEPLEAIVGDKVRVATVRGHQPDPTLRRRQFQVVDLGGAATHAVMRVTYLKQIGLLDEEPDDG